MRIAALAVGLLVAVLLLVHDLPYVTSGRGWCMVEQQPSVLVGAGPGFVTELDCLP